MDKTFNIHWVDDNPANDTITTMGEFKDANGEDDPDSVAELDALKVGQEVYLGGGSAPMCKVERLS